MPARLQNAMPTSKDGRYISHEHQCRRAKDQIKSVLRPFSRAGVPLAEFNILQAKSVYLAACLRQHPGRNVYTDYPAGRTHPARGLNGNQSRAGCGIENGLAFFDPCCFDQPRAQAGVKVARVIRGAPPIKIGSHVGRKVTAIVHGIPVRSWSKDNYTSRR
jgi:hypothetical protein